MNKKIYIIFDQLPPKESGGLIATYSQLVPLLKDVYDFYFISVFDHDVRNNDFPDVKEIINVSNVKTNIQYQNFIKYLKQGKIISALWIPISILIYFLYGPVARKKIVKVVKDDIVIAVSPAAAYYLSKKLKFILEIHTQFEYFFKENKLGSLQTKLMSKPTLTLFRTKTDMEKAKSMFNSYYIYNFFDNSKYVKKHCDSDKFKIAFVGRLEQLKDPLKALECCKKLKENYCDFVLDFYGSGSLESEMKKYIIKNDLESNVRLMGFNDDKNIYNNYSLLWMTSQKEGFGLVIIEAKSFGIPSVVLNWGEGVSEVVENGVDGYIADNVDDFVLKTKMVINNQVLFEELSSNCLKNFNKFSKETARKKWIDILEKFSQGIYKFDE